MLSKYIFLSFYLSIAWLILIFFFGKSGTLHSVNQSNKILKLKASISQSKKDLDEMYDQYHKLLEMKIPDQYFLVSQGRKTEKIIIFKSTEEINMPKYNIKLTESINTKLLIHSISIVLAILLFVFLGLIILFYINNVNFEKNIFIDELERINE